MEDVINDIRKFNRFYTRQIGLLNEHIVESPFSLTEARIMYELAHQENLTASGLAAELGLDAGLLSRILRGFEKRGLVSKKKNEADARQSILSLTDRGQQEFQTLNALSSKQIESLLNDLKRDEQNRLLKAMNEIEMILGEKRAPDKSFILRPPNAGDFGWVVQKNGEIYAEEYNWNEEYEGLVAGIVADFIKNFDPKRERCWIAEKDGQNIGAVFLVKKDETTAKLRLLIVDREARGLGVGGRLVEECTRFARRAGYQKITLWTNSILSAARHLYTKEGYKIVETESHHIFGHDLTSETWELELFVKSQ